MKQVKCIDIVLENCEVIRIMREHIGDFHVLDIKRSISRIAMNSVSGTLSAEEIFIQVSSEANETTSYLTTWSANDTKPFQRIVQSMDISAIDINYEDGSNEEVLVNWGGDSDYTNEKQTADMNEDTGDLYIAISENTTVFDYFENELEEEESNYWSLYEE